MAKVHLVNDARAFPVRLEMEGATSIVPLRAVVLQLPVPQATDELPLPPGSLSLAVHPDVARQLAYDLLHAADQLDRT